MGDLLLEVREFESLTRWTWVLTGPAGEVLADHLVRLDPSCWQYQAFTELQQYLTLHTAPDQRNVQESQIVTAVGIWIGEQVLGPIAGALVAARPTIVRVIVPKEATRLMFLPLELAYFRDRPIALQDVNLIMHPAAAESGDGIMPIGERLRVLGLFSLPVGHRPLHLREERQALTRLFAKIASTGRAVDLRVLQYGVTRARLRGILQDPRGWDVIHISGHGAPGELLLEKDDGSPDLISGVDLASMLKTAKGRLKFLAVSACWSAALTAADQRRLIGLSKLEGTTEESEGQLPDEGVVEALVTELTASLSCAVLAMRYPVTDEFAIPLAEELYGLLAAQGLPLPRALGTALSRVVAIPPTPARPALSAATPALFGASAAELRLRAPRCSSPEMNTAARLVLEGFPAQPKRFVGRTAVMARASAALAPRSGAMGVLLYGMPGGGKTACALELAYTHVHAFDELVWYEAPVEGKDVNAALTDFAVTLETSIPGLEIVHLLGDPGKFGGRLRQLLRDHRALIVIDNIESLVSEEGQWRDARWGTIVSALCGHGGIGRVVMTSRVLPVDLDARLQRDAVDALSVDEALLLARGLPNLRRLMEGSLPGVAANVARRLALSVLNTAQGNPKMLELAEGQAGESKKLQALIEVGKKAWQEKGEVPSGIFAMRETQAGSEDYLYVLGAWCQTVTAGLAPEERDLFSLLCCLEESDRVRLVLEKIQVDVWRRLGWQKAPTRLDGGLAALAANGLISVERQPSESYGIHPSVTAQGKTQAGNKFQEAVDTVLAQLWASGAQQARDMESERPMGQAVIRAGLAAVPYLLRLGRWDDAAGIINLVLTEDPGRMVAASVISPMRKIVREAAQSGQHVREAILAMALQEVYPIEAERRFRSVLTKALALRDYKIAQIAAGHLSQRCLATGRTSEALRFAEKQLDYGQQAGSDPVKQLSHQAVRLQALVTMGQAQAVLAEVHVLLATIPAEPNPGGDAPWLAREMLLNIGQNAAREVGAWEDALEFIEAEAESARARGALSNQVARYMLSSYLPLIKLGQLDVSIRKSCERACR